jgi:predicted lipoprotein
MALNNIQQNLVSEMQAIAEELMPIKNRLALIKAMFLAEGMAQLTDADLQALAPFAHITVAELVAAKNAIEEINTTMGEYVAGSATTRLMKILSRVPR